MFGFDDYFNDRRHEQLSVARLPDYSRHYGRRHPVRPAYKPVVNEYSFSGSQYYPEYSEYQHQPEYQPENDYYDNYYSNHHAYGATQTYKPFWKKKEDDYKEKLKDLGYDISFNMTPSDEFIQILLSEDNELKEFTPLNQDIVPENVEMSFTKSNDNVISFDILADGEYQSPHLIDELTKLMSEYMKAEEDYQSYKTKKMEEDDTEKEERDKSEIKSITQILASDDMVESDVPLGYSKMEIDESEYEVVDIKKTKKVRFDESVKVEDEDTTTSLFPSDISPLKYLFG